jgi:RNAse (barnase) inhibitor barstar
VSAENGNRENAHWAVHEIALTPAATAALYSLAGSLGFDVVRIDLAACGDKTSFLERTAETLAFPAWFGQNWDAFFDCLADLSWRPARGYVLLLEHADTMRRDAPEALDTALAILGDAASAWESRGVPFRVFVSAPGPADAG